MKSTEELLRNVQESLPENDPRRDDFERIIRALCPKSTQDVWVQRRIRVDGVDTISEEGPDIDQSRRDLWNLLHELKSQGYDGPAVAELLSRYEEKDGVIVPKKPKRSN